MSDTGFNDEEQLDLKLLILLQLFDLAEETLNNELTASFHVSELSDWSRKPS